MWDGCVSPETKLLQKERRCKNSPNPNEPAMGISEESKVGPSRSDGTQNVDIKTENGKVR